MSSYLNFYLVPKKTKTIFDCKEDGTLNKKEVKVTEGIPLFFMSFSGASNVYQTYREAVNPVYVTKEDKYTTLTLEMAKNVTESFKEEIKRTEERLAVDYKMLKESGYSEELWDDIHSMESYLKEQNETLEELNFVERFVEESLSEYSDFEEVLINID